MLQRWSGWHFVLAAALLASSAARAQSYSWSGGTGSWTTGTNWTPNGIPTTGDNVTIAQVGGANVTIMSTVQCASLTLGGVSSPQTLTLTNATTGLQVTGTCTIASLGTLTVVTNSNLSDGGSGTCNIQSAGVLTMSGGTISTKTVAVAMGGTLTMSGGSLSNNTVSIASGGTFNLTGGAISSATVNNSGVTVWSTASFDLGFVSTFNNLAGATFVASTAGTHITSGMPPGMFTNAGTFTSAAPSGTISLDSGVSFSNSGSLTVGTNTLSIAGTYNSISAGTLMAGTYLLSGTLALTGTAGSITTNAANVTLASSTTAIMNNVGTNMLTGLSSNSGSLSLAGGATIATTGSLTNSGSITVGTTPCMLTVNGTYTQTAPALFISQATSASQFGVLAVSGMATLNGIVGVVFGYMPALGDSFPVITFTSVSGQFSSIVPPTTPNGFVLSQAVNATNVNLIVSNPGAPTVASISPMSAASGSAAITLTVNGTNFTAMSVVKFNGAPLTTMFVSATQLTATIPAASLTGAGPQGVSVLTGANSSNSAIFNLTANAPPVIASVTPSLPVAPLSGPVTFTAVASDPNNLPLTFSWSFGDGSAVVMGNPVTYAYTIEGTYTVTLTVSNGSLTATTTIPEIALGPNSGGAGITNLFNGIVVINPFDGVSMTLTTSNGGLCTFGIDVSSVSLATLANRDAFSVSTEFDTIGGRAGTVTGISPIFKADQPGIYVAKATVTNVATGASGNARKMIGMSGAEVGAPSVIKNQPKSHNMTKSTTKGKFFLAPASTRATGVSLDTVTFSATIELPEGLDVSTKATQSMAFGIGNIFDQVTLNAKGGPVGAGMLKLFKTVHFSFPKPPKGSTTTGPGQMAKFTITLNEAGMSAAGFDTEGIVNHFLPTEKGMKSVNRSIQVAMVLGGVAWQSTAKVSYTLQNNGAVGNMSGRGQ